MIAEKMMTCYTIINAMTEVLLFDATGRLKGAGVCDEVRNSINNRGRKRPVWSLRFASDLESEEFNDETAMIGGFPWEMRHNYPSMMTLYTIIFSMMTHRHRINEA